MGFTFSFKKKIAKTAANIGAKYRKETAVPMGKYFVDIKNNVIEVTPTKPLIISNFLLFPKMDMLDFNRIEVVITKVEIDLKKSFKIHANKHIVVCMYE